MTEMKRKRNATMSERPATGSPRRQTSRLTRRYRKPPGYVCHFEWSGFRLSGPFSFALAPQASPLRFRDFLSPELLNRLHCRHSANNRVSDVVSISSMELPQLMSDMRTLCFTREIIRTHLNACRVDALLRVFFSFSFKTCKL